MPGFKLQSKIKRVNKQHKGYVAGSECLPSTNKNNINKQTALGHGPTGPILTGWKAGLN